MKIRITIDQRTAHALLGDLIDLYSSDDAHLILPADRPEAGIDDVLVLSAAINDAPPTK